MKALHLIPLLFLTLTLPVCAEHTFAGAFGGGPFPVPHPGIAAGSILLTVDEGQASFQCTLFSYIPVTNLQAWLKVGHRRVPVDLGTGVQGTWPLSEFLWPVPGVPPAGQGGVDPGFGIPPTAEGTRFTGSFTAFHGLEHAMLLSGATVYLQVHGAASGLQDPLLSATL